MSMKKTIFAPLVVVVIGLWCAWSFAGAGRIENPRNFEQGAAPTFIAHRGYSNRYPENTVRSILEAVDHGAEWVEVDVRWTRDGQAVLHHDENLKKSLGLDHKVGEVAASEVRARPIIGTAESVPTLDEAMAAMAGDRAKLYLHLKDGELSADEAHKLVSLCRAHGFLRRVRFNSGSFATLEKLRAEDPKIWLEFDLYDAKGLLWPNRLSPQDLLSIGRLAVHSVGTFSFKIDAELVREAHRHGLLIDALVSAQGMPFHAENAAYRDMLRLHVDEIMTDDISRYLVKSRAL
jgi:glycerophosphoryl diester phosphodiesterase